MNAEQMLAILRDGTPDQRRSFVASLPENSFKDMALTMLQGRQPGAVVVGLGPMITKYCAGADPDTGAQLALAAHTLALEIYESGRDPALLPMTVSGLAFQYVNALNLLGRSEDVLSFTERFIPYYERLAAGSAPLPGLDAARAAQARLGEQQNVQSLKTARLGALVNLQRIDEAERMLEDAQLRGNPATEIEIDRLEGKIRDIKSKIFRVPGERSAPRDPQPAMAAAVEELAGSMGDLPPPLIEQLRKTLASAKPTDPSSPAGFRDLLKLLAAGERVLTGGEPADNEWTLKRIVREASGIFVLHKQPARETIEKSLGELERALASARAKGLSEVQNDALWGIYLCHSRLAQPSKAADALIALRQNLERLRAGIADPVERGGVFSAYAHLSGALCEKLHAAGRAEDLLIAIEASKGRGIADILTRKSSQITADADIYRSAEQLPSLTRRHEFHYLSYFVNTEKVYAVLVSKQGEIHLLPAVKMLKDDVREVALAAEPRKWGRPLDYDAARHAPDVSEALAPLAAILEPLMDRRVLAAGDHICYSPHDSFHNVPLQYLRLRGKRIADFFSVSRTHNAFQVAMVLRANAAPTPSQFRGFVVPTVQDTRHDDWDSREVSLTRPVALLAKSMRGEEYRGAAASLARLKSLDLRAQILHFSTHGIFPSLSEAQNPFTESGLVMADGANLPDENALGAKDRPTVLTPEKVFYGDLDLRGSHVSVMACVSGLARDGLGGDALGMDWAFLQAGAASLLSSHWQVNAELAAEFFCLFYEAWLGEGKGRGEALRETIRRLRAREGDAGEPYSWAAFSLAGDWR
jgi:CHAT domain-containing protein